MTGVRYKSIPLSYGRKDLRPKLWSEYRVQRDKVPVPPQDDRGLKSLREHKVIVYGLTPILRVLTSVPEEVVPFLMEVGCLRSSTGSCLYI